MPPYATGASHYLTSTGHVTIDEPTGLVIALTSLPAWLGSVVSDPIDYHQLGRYALGNADGFLPSQPLEHANLLLWPVPSGLTLVGLTLAPGVVATLTELTGGLADLAAYNAAEAARIAAVAALAAMTADRDAQVASLATRTTERDTARNSLYVSGTYLSGQTWQTKDGTDLAAYNTAEAARIVAVAALAAALAPSSSQRVHVDYSTGTIFPGVNVATLGGVPTNTLGASVSSSTITIPKSGRYEINAMASALGSGSRVNNLQWWIYQNGTVLVSRTIDTMAGAYLKDAMEWEGPLVVNDAIQVRFNPASPANVQPEAYITLTFVPTAANPH